MLYVVPSSHAFIFFLVPSCLLVESYLVFALWAARQLLLLQGRDGVADHPIQS